MFSWTVILLFIALIALVAGLLSFIGIAGTAIMFARIIFGMALVLFLAAHLLEKRMPRV